MAYRNEPLVPKSKLRGFKVRLYPTKEQEEILFRQIALYRWVYNWMIELERNAMNTEGKFISYRKVEKLFQQVRKEKEWLQELPLGSAREALTQCDRAWDMCFKYKMRPPQFKSRKKNRTHQAFHFRNEKYAFYFKDGYVKIPGFKKRGEMVQCKTVPFNTDAAMYKCGVIYDGRHFWLTVNVEVDRSYLAEHEKTDEVIGIDLGCVNLAYLSNGTVYKPPKLRRLLKRKSQNHRRLAKMRNKRIAECKRARTKLDNIPETKNETKLIDQQRKLLKKITNIKTTYAHTITKEIVEQYPSKIVIEDLNIRYMIRRHFHTQGNYDPINPEMFLMWAKIRDYLKYKSEERGIELIIAERGFKSTQICSNCGAEHKLAFTRVYKCPNCGLEIDRDYNAALNLRNYGIGI